MNKDKLKDKIYELIEKSNEEEWFEFKENWYEAHSLGEYISALANSAAVKGEPYAYFVWGINDLSHEITGTKFNFNRDFNNEPLKHYLERNLSPDLAFNFEEIIMEGRRVVVLIIPSAGKVPVSFDGERYIRIGSSKTKLNKYPDREAELFRTLKNGIPTIENTRSEYQDLTFEMLKVYYSNKGLHLNEETYKKNLGLLTEDGEYNVMAQLLSDDCHMPIRVSIFAGTDKASRLCSVREFGFSSILLAMDKILQYGDVLNLVQADEKPGVYGRNDVPYFDYEVFKEAVTNAFVHNRWIDGNAPMFTVYSDRFEILSRGSFAAGQTKEGFYKGESVPVNSKLSDIFLQLRLSERSGRGVPLIVSRYGKDIFEFRENSIVVNIPFNIIYNLNNRNTYEVKEAQFVYKSTYDLVLEKIMENPHITQPEIAKSLDIGKTTVQKNIVLLKKNGIIEHIGANKNGYWKINK
ncbi:MAG: putative DNA binding domain-containing protein [Erysipelotrichaceae bacterium]|nr:putative DNA binding domain-containing protein [Erysipelotrichaceae bacterium]